MEQKKAMSHLWPGVHTVTTLYHIEASYDRVTMNHEHRDHQWVSTLTLDHHSYIHEMARMAGIFKTE